MAEDSEQFDRSGFAKISDETIHRFLLGRLAAGELVAFEAFEAFEKRLFRDEDLEERVRLAELELADDYAFERLIATDRELFEKAFAVSAARRQQLSVSTALRDSSLLAAEPEAASLAEIRPTGRDVLRRLFGINRPLLGYAIGFAALLLFAGIVWVVVKERSNQPAIATNGPAPVASPAIAHPTESQTPGVTVSPEPPAKASPTAEVSSSHPVIATFVLSPGALRDGGEMTRVAVPQSERGKVRLQLRLETEEPGPYAAELLTAEGQPIYISRRLKTNNTASGLRVVFDVPAELLKKNDYQVRLNRTAGGATTSAGRYSFRVIQ